MMMIKKNKFAVKLINNRHARDERIFFYIKSVKIQSQ